MMNTRAAAVTDATAANRARYRDKYLVFCAEYKVAPLSPTAHQLCMYLQYLFTSMSSVASMKNYLSGARVFIDLYYGDTSGFDTRAVQEMKKGMEKLSTHVVVQAPPLFPPHITQLCYYFDSKGVEGVINKAAILISYFCFLRQSNVVSYAQDNLSPHVLMRGDIYEIPEGLCVVVRSSKTIKKKSDQVAIPVHRLEVPASNCPVTAYNLMTLICPAGPCAPAFHTPTGIPVTTQSLQKALRDGLTAIGLPNSKEFSLHSLRRGASQIMACSGVSVYDVKLHGTWTSDSVYKYTPRQLYSAVPSTMSAVFGSHM